MTGDFGISAVLVALLLVKHYVCDFLLQTPIQIRSKGIYGHPGGLLHAAIHVAGTALVAFPFMTAGMLAIALLAEFVIHYHLDWGKERVGRLLAKPSGPGYWSLFGGDQLLHQLTYVGMAVWAARADG
ncbi:MAG: DUF3307 domain-containing protein [Rhizobiaceae bacterium]